MTSTSVETCGVSLAKKLHTLQGEKENGQAPAVAVMAPSEERSREPAAGRKQHKYANSCYVTVSEVKVKPEWVTKESFLDPLKFKKKILSEQGVTM